MSELQKYVALGPLRAAHPGDEVNEHIWCAAPEVDAALAAKDAEIERLRKALKKLESDAHNHHVHGRIVDFASSITEARAALASADGKQREQT